MFISKNLGSKFIEPPILRLNQILEDSNERSPIIFFLSPGTDPGLMLKHLADEKQIYPDRYFALSLGQGQMVAAKRLLDMGVTRVIYLNE